MNYYVKGDAANAGKIKAAFEKLGIDVLDFGFADKTVVYCSIGGCVQSLPYSINLMHILYSHPDYQELELTVKPKFKVGDRVIYKGNVCTITFMDEVYYDFDGGVAGCRIEKQDELLSAASKFKVGDWVVTDYGKVSQVVSVDNAGDGYTLDDGIYFSGSWCDMYHLWSIADVKYGDVLANTAGCILIAKDNESCLCYIDKNGEFHANNNKWFFANFSDNALMPATKEQRKLLFHKMKESGYELNEKKKGLHKIIEPKFNVGDKVIYKGKVRTITRIVENYYEFDGWSASCRIEKQDELLSPAPKSHYDITNFSAGMPVLVRDSNDDEWNYLFFSHYRKKMPDHFFAGGNPWSQCIPFNENTEYLLGTSDMCPEEYINW